MRRGEESEILEGKHRWEDANQPLELKEKDSEEQPVKKEKRSKSRQPRKGKSKSPPIKQTVNLKLHKDTSSSVLKLQQQQYQPNGQLMDMTQRVINPNIISSLHQMNRERSNIDISEVYEMDDEQITFSGVKDETGHLDHMGVKTSTVFLNENGRKDY